MAKGLDINNSRYENVIMVQLSDEAGTLETRKQWFEKLQERCKSIHSSIILSCSDTSNSEWIGLACPIGNKASVCAIIYSNIGAITGMNYAFKVFMFNKHENFSLEYKP